MQRKKENAIQSWSWLTHIMITGLAMLSTTSPTVTPPALPQDAVYTSHYCEENVYLLIQSFFHNPSISEIWDIFAVFISNHARTVALWNQKLSNKLDWPVIWDYHVIAVLRAPKGSSIQSWVYDFDTHLGMPVTWNSYFSETFSMTVPEAFQSTFRVVPAEVYLDHFASDRSHMLDTKSACNPSYLKPLPPYPPLQGSFCIKHAVTHNLMDFVSMHPSDGYGDVFGIRTIHDFFASEMDDTTKPKPTATLQETYSTLLGVA
ncbi:hypothetical protein GYMLUDRAFT_661749 [Collybiopsis luxurians FD-317 M1]|uniref:Protein N-terminal glutamine amidohydrolase n=1 Tax=Collybiopsis luxurians FD-317 M1 TaxID=944289 RepID=A0A0D0B8E0_9AGAR|nr:hypothetical protein GYMLUDRAFT_661749 [Collybiopsis luxurians FD-317 M1]